MSEWPVRTKDGHIEIDAPFFRTRALFQNMDHFSKRGPLLKAKATFEIVCILRNAMLSKWAEDWLRQFIRLQSDPALEHPAKECWRDWYPWIIQYKYWPVLRQNVRHSQDPCLHCQKQQLSSRRRRCVVVSDGNFLMRSQPKIHQIYIKVS